MSLNAARARERQRARDYFSAAGGTTDQLHGGRAAAAAPVNSYS